MQCHGGWRATKAKGRRGKKEALALFFVNGRGCQFKGVRLLAGVSGECRLVWGWLGSQSDELSGKDGQLVQLKGGLMCWRQGQL